MNRSNAIWSLVGLAAVMLSGHLLYQELHNLSLAELNSSFTNISLSHWLLAGLATLGAYAALAWYDRIACAYLGQKIPWWFISLCSFTTYALAHNIGASVFSGAVVRYRAYRSKGLTACDIGTLIAFCSLTFVLGVLLTSGLVLLITPELLARFLPSNDWQAQLLGALLLGLVLFYTLGSRRPNTSSPLSFRGWQLHYPRPSIVAKQLLAGFVELLCAAAIIYFALPSVHNPGFIIILGIFIASFSLALLSHAPGGLGVLEITFLTALPEMQSVDVLAALIVFRFFYLLLPFALAIIMVIVFESSQWSKPKVSYQQPPEH